MAESPSPGVRACRETLRLPGEKQRFAECQLEVGHRGLHVAADDFERITTMAYIDGGNEFQHTSFVVTWSTRKMSTVEAGRDSPEWRASLNV